MEYHKTDAPLRLREYGRCLQRMVAHLKTIEDRALRTRMAHEAVRSMAILNPAGREMQEYRKKLWDHLFRIADYDLDVDSPFPPPERPETQPRPPRPAYTRVRASRRHYGRNVEQMIKKAVEMTEPEHQLAYARQIASYMKLMSRMASGDPNAPDLQDSVIFKHLYEMSGGKLQLDPEQTQLVQGFKPTHITNQSTSLYQRKRKKKKFTKAPNTQAFTQPSGDQGAGGGFRKKKRNKRFRGKGGPGGGDNPTA